MLGCTTSMALSLLACSSVPAAAPQAAAPPLVSEARPELAWQLLRALHYEVVGDETVHLVSAQAPASVGLTLEPSPSACNRVDADGLCHAGCFQIVAVGWETSVEDLSVTVALESDASDVIAESVTPGPVASSGFCYSFPAGHSGKQRVRVAISTANGSGEVSIAPWRHQADKSLSYNEVTLNFPSLGDSRESVLAAHPNCHWDDSGTSCTEYLALSPLPTSEQCDGGCSRQVYHFEGDTLRRIQLRREVADADITFFGKFATDALSIARALDKRMGQQANEVQDLKRWTEVQTAQGEFDISRRVWRTKAQTVRWRLSKVPGHHPVALLTVDIEETPKN